MQTELENTRLEFLQFFKKHLCSIITCKNCCLDINNFTLCDILIKNSLVVTNISEGISNSVYKIEFDNKHVNSIINAIEKLHYSHFKEECNIKLNFNLPIIFKNAFVFRWYGSITKLVDRELEINIIKHLNNNDLGPSILYFTNIYRIEDYLSSCRNIDINELLNLEILKKLYISLSKYKEINSKSNFNYLKIWKNYNYLNTNEKYIKEKVDELVLAKLKNLDLSNIKSINNDDLSTSLIDNKNSTNNTSFASKLSNPMCNNAIDFNCLENKESNTITSKEHDIIYFNEEVSDLSIIENKTVLSSNFIDEIKDVQEIKELSTSIDISTNNLYKYNTQDKIYISNKINKYKLKNYDYAIKCNEKNLYTFSEELAKLAYATITELKNNILNKNNYLMKNNDYIDFENKISKLDSIVNNSMHHFKYTLSPLVLIFVLSHNDIHTGNLLISQDSKLYLIDHEFAFYNILGFEICNIFFQTTFLLNKSYPFYCKNITNYDEFLKDKYYKDIYVPYINNYFNENSLNFCFENEPSIDINQMIKNLKYEYLSKSMYLKLLATASLFYTLYNITKITYDNIINSKNCLSFIDFSIEKYSIFEYIYENYLKD